MNVSVVVHDITTSSSQQTQTKAAAGASSGRDKVRPSCDDRVERRWARHWIHYSRLETSVERDVTACEVTAPRLAGENTEEVKHKHRLQPGDVITHLWSPDTVTSSFSSHVLSSSSTALLSSPPLLSFVPLSSPYLLFSSHSHSLSSPPLSHRLSFL